MHSMANRLKTKFMKFTTLPAADQGIFFAALMLLPWFWLALRVLGLRRLQEWLHTPAAAESNPDLVQAKRLARLVNRAAQQPVVPATCLSRSLLLQWFLKRQGIASQLCIGIDKTATVFKAHAWVECAGVPVNDQPNIAQHFAAFPPLRPESMAS